MQHPYPEEFFAIQIAFARKTSEISSQLYAEAILRNTALYRIFGLDWSLDPVHPVWQAYVQGLKQTEEDVHWTYQYYLERYAADTIPSYNTPRWGCFSYEYASEQQVIHMHFSNLDFSGYGPLSHLRKDARIADLRSMYAHIKRFHPDAQKVIGSSWLYNREAYTRLFPKEYGESARASRLSLIGRGLWGQFLRRDERINQQLADLFLKRVSQLRIIEQQEQCFPYQMLIVEAPIELFYAFYGI